MGVLGRVERAEAALRRLGFVELRVRHYGDLARLEVPVDELDRVRRPRAEVVDAVRGAGYRYVTLDLEGLAVGQPQPARWVVFPLPRNGFSTMSGIPNALRENIANGRKYLAQSGAEMSR